MRNVLPEISKRLIKVRPSKKYLKGDANHPDLMQYGVNYIHNCVVVNFNVVLLIVIYTYFGFSGGEF